jgi:hypothetical protein
MVAQTRRHVSFMYSFPNYIPLAPAKVRQVAAALEPLAFDSIYGAWTGLNVKGGGKQAVAVSVGRYLAAME